MRSNSILALTGILGVVAAVPLAGQPRQHQHHQHQRRKLIWETVTEEVIQTIPVTRTIWLEPGETPPAAALQHYSSPSPPAYTPPASSTPAYTPPASSPAPPVESSPVPSSSPAPPPPASTPSSSYVAPPPTSTYVPPPSPTSTYVPPPPPTSTYVPPPAPVTPSSSYVAPAPVTPSSSYVAPAPSASAPATGGSGITYGPAKSGTYYTGDLTYYEPGMGACGIMSTADEHIVAVAQSIFDQYTQNGNPNNNPLCGSQVSITGADGSQYTATIVDRCTGCADADLDLTEPFFNLVTGNGDGRVGGMKWCFS